MSILSTLSLIIAKGMLITLNLVFIFLAVCMHSFATMDLKILSDYGKGYVGGSFVAYMVILLVCIFLTLMSLFGCLATVKENAKFLYTYIIILSAYLILQWIILAVFVSMKRFGPHHQVSEWLKKDFFSNATGDVKEKHDQLWDEMQTDYNCCGFNGPEDYITVQRPIKVSCCLKTHLARTDIPKEDMYRTCIKSEFYYKSGCGNAILRVLTSYDEWVFRLTGIGFWVEAVDMLLALYVANRIKNKSLPAEAYRTLKSNVSNNNIYAT